MGSAEEFNFLYKNVSDSIKNSMENIAILNVDNEEGKHHIGNISDKLSAIKVNFDEELKMLEENAEWEKFTIAFFGITGAGKSTIIESLRILFKEEVRQKLLEKNAHDLQNFEQELSAHVNNIRHSLNIIYADYAADIEKINQRIESIANVVKAESGKRIRKKLIIVGVIGAITGGIITGTSFYLMFSPLIWTL